MAARPKKPLPKLATPRSVPRTRGADPLALLVRGLESATKLAPSIVSAVQAAHAPASDGGGELQRVELILAGIEERLGVPATSAPASERLAYLAGMLRGMLPRKGARGAAP